jgi:CheY-like chemotaxis protein
MTGTSTTRPRVLLCDDSPVVRRLLRRVLEESGCVVSEADDLAAAAAALHAGPYDVVVADLQEPRSDRRLLFAAAHQQGADVVVLTGAELAAVPDEPNWDRSITKTASAAIEVADVVKGLAARRRPLRPIRFTMRHPLHRTA